MNTCRVLRCEKPVDTVHAWSKNPWHRIEFGVCAEHSERLEAGEERAYQRDDPERVFILMDGDVAAVADAFVDQIKVLHLTGVNAPDGTGAIRVLLGTTRRSDGRTEEIEFALSGKVAEQLTRMLGFNKPLNPDPEP